jgi:hypothetical protein
VYPYFLLPCFGFRDPPVTIALLFKNFLQEKAVEATKQEKERKEEKT